jgi:uncharacterized protein YjbI with pentapeptide repeats
MNANDLKTVLDLHSKWLKGDPSGSRADLSRADLSGADLYAANLNGSNLSGANLRDADLSRALGVELALARAPHLTEGAVIGMNAPGVSTSPSLGSIRELLDLSLPQPNRAGWPKGETMDTNELQTVLSLHSKWFEGDPTGSRADLRGADLSGAFLYRANLSGADLSGANLMHAELRRATLTVANLSGAALRHADLSRANLAEANLGGADLTDADLRGANLRYANLSGAVGAELALAQASHLGKGLVTGWKKCKSGVIVKLLVPEGAKRSHGNSRKCRAEYADVLEVFGAEVGISVHDGKTEYRPGARVMCDKWDDDRWNECSGGIHFFITRIEAEGYST